MLRKIALGIALTLMLTTMLVLAFEIQQAEASGTIYIRADGSIDPLTANIASSDYVTYYFTDNNYDEIVIERSDIIIDGNGYTLQGSGNGDGFDLAGITNVTIRNTTIKSFEIGIILAGALGKNTITRNEIIANAYQGIHLAATCDNTIVDNNITDNGWVLTLPDSGGIILRGDGENNEIIGNNITNNVNGIGFFEMADENWIMDNFIADNSFGIKHYKSNSNMFVSNNITGNTFGIILERAGGHTICSNNITNNGEGICLGCAFYNTIMNNDITGNTAVGITLFYVPDWGGASDNTFYHNNLIDNGQHVYIEDPEMHPGEFTNSWDNGCEGNYWDDYNGIDSDGDGIGDTSYVILIDNIDRYPLMNRCWNPCDINHDLTVNLRDIGTSARAFGTQPGDERWNCHADITGGGAYLEPDNRVNMRDIALIARNFGETYP